MQSTYDSIFAKIMAMDRGYAFSYTDFKRFGKRGSIDVALAKLCREGHIRRVLRGVYDYPRYNEKLGGILGPDIGQVAKAIARKNGWRIQPSGAVAANNLGLTTQVPAKIIYLTDGRSKTYEVGGQKLRFKRVAPRELTPGSEVGVLVTQALRNLKQKHVDDVVIRHLCRIVCPAVPRHALPGLTVIL